ncbi:MAG: 3-hydroxyacyl-CoA dehydrogenase NAD-binding domain-containing protein [Hydrotalea sp.]|nr:3-hydroxyacyl-CoA dehydrogenase NAD-binding domain-containing protein [Hydrotalea sp.]
MRQVKTLGLIGGGVIGGAWGARAIIHGLDVVLFDPAPNAEKSFMAILNNARFAWQQMTMSPLPKEGSFKLVSSLQELAKVADWVQESAPENPELKTKIMAELTESLPADVGIGSSTSGILPSIFQAKAKHPERIFVAHPFNPVYLLPLLEICPGGKTSKEWLQRAKEFYETLGFQPLMMDREVEGFIADRLMETLWREALHMIENNEATAEQLDDAVRFGCGIRWAFMGTFMTYRLAGGEMGMHHFMKQFGPALEWNWTRLKAPPLTDELLNKIVAQSDGQMENSTDWKSKNLRDMERQRDEAIIGIMQSLRTLDMAAGKTLKKHEDRLYALAHRQETKIDDSKPLPLFANMVLPKWVDYNEHMTEFAYLENFGNATDAVLRHIGMDAAYIASGFSFFTVESHICHIGQMRVGERFQIVSQVLGGGDKKLRLFHHMYKMDGDKLGAVVATAEHFCLHVDHKTEKSCAAHEPVLSKLQKLIAAQSNLAMPERAGRKIG